MQRASHHPDFPTALFARIPPGTSHILDFGYGHGELLRALHEEKDCRGLCGVEVEDHSQEVDGGGAPAVVETVLADWSRTAVETPRAWRGRFTFVTAVFTLEHAADPLRALTRLREVLAPRGRLLAQCRNAAYWEHAHTLLTGSPANKEAKRYPDRPLSLEWLVAAAQEAGFFLEDFDLLLHEAADLAALEALAQGGGLSRVRLPPPELPGVADVAPLLVTAANGSSPVEWKRRYPLLLAPAFLAEFSLAV